MSSTLPHVVVVGAGPAGLAATVELASHGCRVTLGEKNNHLGGKLNVLSEDGYTFDMGPTILTIPQVLRGIIRRSGRKPEDYLDLIDLDPQWRCFYPDGTKIDLLKNAAEMARSLDAQFPDLRPGAGYQKFVDWSRRMFRLSEKVFFYKDLGGIADMMRKPPTDPGMLGDVMSMRMHSTVAATIHKLIPAPHMRQLCEHFLQYVGSSPFLAPAILGLIASAQVDQGCWYPMGGTRKVAQTLGTIAGELGVEVITGQKVKTIHADSKSARAVELEDGRIIEADAVVSNCDVQRTYRDLIDEPKANAEFRAIESKYKPACAGVVLYLGLDRQYDQLAHHNFIFSADSDAEFNDIYHKGIPARAPTLYIAAPSRTDPHQAPEGGEALYILVHTAYLRDGHDWQNSPTEAGPLLKSYRETIIKKLAQAGMDDVEQHIKLERFLTPQGIEQMYNAEGGAIYGLASHGKLAGGFKPRNRSRVYKNLYLTGGSANPGPGVPMVLMSGVTAARSVLEDHAVPTNDEWLSVRENNSSPATAGA